MKKATATHLFSAALFLLSSISGTSAQPWTNPLTLNGEWPSYGIGDPYIMKYRGTYYLYCSTRDNYTGIKCWSTRDFVTWSNAVTCSTDAITKTAYAPEVVYWNGTFYMYTSPAGNGHYVLSSNSPTGPFIPVTGNVGRSIDGSVFIDDDGKWFFYYASNNGIVGCPMPSPTTFGNESGLTPPIGYGWTEAPCVIKRNGYYYLLYSGNHVLSNGYRVDYARNASSPITAFSAQAEQNPILLNAEGPLFATAHGTAFIGPDLDTYYYTYHNLVGRLPNRKLNFDRIGWNGDKLLLMGPTWWEQQPFRQADRVDFFDREAPGENWLMPNGGHWTIRERDCLIQDVSDNATEPFYKAILNHSTGADYTAEFTLKEEQRDSSAARIGVVFGYTGEDNYGTAVLNGHLNRLEINFRTNGVWATPEYCTLPAGYTLNVWHHLRIEKSRTVYKFFVDGMLKATMTNALGAGKTGYLSSWNRAAFGYIAFSNQVNGSGIYDVYKPAPGIIQAVHYNTGGEGAGYHDLTPGNTAGRQSLRNDSVDVVAGVAEGGFAITGTQPGEWYCYNINAKTTGLYHVGLRYATAETTSRIRILKGDDDLTGIVTLPSTGGTSVWRTFTLKNLPLTAGFQTIRLEVAGGGFAFSEMQWKEASDEAVTLTDAFNTAFGSNWNYTDGNWKIEAGEASINGHGKRTIGHTGWTDYTVQTDITCVNGYNGGLILRVNNPSLGGNGTDPALGTDYLQGYYVNLTANGVSLGKHNYNWKSLVTATAGTYALNQKHTLRAVVTGANIKVYVDDMTTPKIDYTDPRPIISGKVGYRVCNSYVRFDNFSVTTHHSEPPSAIALPAEPGGVQLSPNPVSTTLTLHNAAGCSGLTISRPDGQVIYRNVSGAPGTIDVAGFDKGLYILQLKDIAGDSHTYKFIKQ